MHVFKISFSLLIILILNGCSTMLEYVDVPGKLTGWKIRFQKIERFSNDSIREFIPENESINNWSKMITVQFKSGRKDSPKLFMETLKISMEKQCKNTIWKIIKKNNNSILYEWRISNCEHHSDQHEIARLLRGNDGLHRTAYTEKIKEISTMKRQEWIEKFTNTVLKKNGKIVNVL